MTYKVANGKVVKSVKAVKSGFVISGEQAINAHFAKAKSAAERQWADAFAVMSGANVDLTLLGKPILSTDITTFSGHKLGVVVFDNSTGVIGAVAGALADKKQPEYLIQVWSGLKSVIIKVPRNANADRNWRDEVLPLTQAEQALTSWLLNASESGQGWFVVDDVVKSVADKNKMYSVFSVLD